MYDPFKLNKEIVSKSQDRYDSSEQTTCVLLAKAFKELIYLKNIEYTRINVEILKSTFF